MNSRIRNLLLTVSALAPIALAPVLANPLGPQVVGGSATVQGQGTSAVTVTQQSNSAIINWNTFNIGAGEKTSIAMPSASSVQLDRVTGNLGPSQIYGTLSSNGRVFLVNPDGILFGSGAVVDTAGFLATTHDIANADFMAGRYNFSIPGNPSASIVNQGTITAQSGGFAALVAPGVRNSGTITATLGIVTLASGNSFTLDFYGDKLITLGVNDSIATQVKDVATGQSLSSLVTNDGKLSANGGRVELTAAAARTVVDSVINTTGVIEANTIGNQNGMIVLGAATGSSKPAGAPTQTVKVSGTLSAAGKNARQIGGKIQISGQAIKVTGAKIDASGVAGGGKVLIGGDVGGGKPSPLVASLPQAQLEANPVPTATSVIIDAATTINASATGAGDGGKVVVWSDGATSFNGTILATGGTLAGNGGFVETSGHVLSFADGRVDTSAPYGRTGSWLLDPYDLTIDSAAAATIATSLATTNVTIQTTASGTSGPGVVNPSGNGDIEVAANISWNTVNLLTLSAYRNIVVDNGVTISNTSSGPAGFIPILRLLADNTGTDVGTVIFNGTGKVDFSSFIPGSPAVAINYNPPGGYLHPTDYSTAVLGSLRALMLVNNVNDLQNISLNLSGQYGLAKDIDAAGVGFTPIGTQAAPFVGLFYGQKLDGSGATISNLTINSGAQNVGLFGYNQGAVIHIGLTDANIVGTAPFSVVGAIVGVNMGSNYDAYSTGSVTGSATSIVGGLVGLNGGFMANDYSLATVSGSGTPPFGFIGGLVGVNQGQVFTSYAAGRVSGTGTGAGGLIGINSGTVSDSYWDIQATGQTTSGGGTGLTTTQAFTQSSYSGWGFTSIGAWFMIDGQTRPFLRSEYSTVITNSHQLQLMSLNPSASYTLANNIDLGPDLTNPSSMWGPAGFVPIQSLSGQFDGQGWTISNLTIAPTATNTSGNIDIGLFGVNSGVIKNLNLANVDIQTNPNLMTLGDVGALAGSNYGLIDHVTVSGTINGGNASSSCCNFVAGGLVGRNEGHVQNSSAAVAMTFGDNVLAGGLVGQNDGTITGSSANGNVSVGTNSTAGGLVGTNSNVITGSSANGNVSVGTNSTAGGLVGDNETFTVPSTHALIDQSFATGDVSSTAVNVLLGGLVAFNSPGAMITRSYATGNVTASANTNFTGTDCSQSGNCTYAVAGGLAGENDGTIQGTAVPSQTQPCVAGQTCATGLVNVGSNGIGGGLAGFNNGIITNTFATGAVTGAAGVSVLGHGGTKLAGLVGANLGLISNSHATGNVGTLNVADLQVGGLVSDNEGKIANSYATGNVSAGDHSQAGGLSDTNSPSDIFSCSGCTPPDGSAYFNVGLISNSYATGNVTVAAASLAGGLLASTDSTVNNAHASGAVSGGDNSILGGLVGITDLPATITNSAASGAVSSTGPNSWVGGFVGANGGAISLSSASGPVSGTSDSLLGGFVGLNFGVITDSTAVLSATATGTGANNFVGGFVGVNLGLIDPSTAAGGVTGGANNMVGGFAGANASLINVPDGQIPGSSFPNGTVSADSIGNGQATGGPGSTVGAQIGTSYPTALPASPSVVASCQNGALCSILQTNMTFAAAPTAALTPLPPPITQISPLDDNTGTTQAPILASLTTSSSPDSASSSSNATPGKPGYVPPPLPRRTVPGLNGETRSSVPPPGENRFLQNQVLLQLGLNISNAELTRIVGAIDARVVTSETLDFLGRRAIRLELPAGMTVRDAILRLEANRLVSVAAPIYQFHLAQSAGTASKGDPAQYILNKLHLDGAHRLATGKGVTVALIDSEVDQRHTELQGAISGELEALGQKEPPHSHGTAMAGAIVSHDRLLGVAPGARIVAVHAFGNANNTAEATTVSILKGIEWAVDQGARVINMSFTGPRDPSLERAFKAAHQRGVVLVAAAGNDGPKSPPLYPGADPNVIAVTASDAHDGAMRQANQGPQLSVAAPGVEILAPAPEETYQMSTGTSIATAHVSGVVALMLERDPTLKPDDIRKILEETATDLGPPGKDNQFGWGLVNPQKALEEIATRRKVSDASAKIH